MKYFIHLITFLFLSSSGLLYAQSPVDDPCPTPPPPSAEWPIDGTCHAMDTWGMTPFYDPGTCFSGDYDDAWAWFTGDGNLITVNYDPFWLYDAVLHVFDATLGCASAIEIDCSDTGFSGDMESISFPSTSGHLYLVRVQRWGSNATMTGDLCITSAGPGSTLGNDCTNPIRVACGDPILAGETTIGNGNTESDWSCSPVSWGLNATPGEDRFYVVQWQDASSGGTIRFDFTNVTDFNDPYFEFYYLGTSCSPNTCSNHSQFDITTGTVNGSSLRYFDISVPPGVQDHYFVVDAQNEGIDSYDLEVTCYATGIELDQSNTCGGSLAPCNYRLDMFDSYGDGWNGAYINFYVNGSNAGPYSASGYGTIQSIPVDNADPLQLDYISGLYDDENSFILRDGRGVILHSETPSPNTGTLHTSSVSDANCGFDPSNPNRGVYCIWQELDALGNPIGSEYLAPATQDPAEGGHFRICENIYLQNPSGFEWLKYATINVGDCWTNISNITPNGSSNGFYDIAGNWTATWNSGTREINYTFVNSRDATWGDGNNTSAGYTCNLYQFCYDAEVNTSCSPTEGFQNGIDVTDDGIGGGGGSTGAATVVVASTSPTTNVLPIELISFDARVIENKNNKQVELTWATLSEINNDFFSIERSIDGKTFEYIGQVDGQGESNTEVTYTFIDENPYTGISYYRLSQTDYNKKSETFKPKSVNIDAESSVMLYPNPSNGLVTIEALSIKKITVRAITSEVIEQYDVNGKDKVTLKLSLKPGVYYLSIDSDSGQFHKSLIIN